MGNSSSSLVDCVQDYDTQRLKQQLASRVADVEDGEVSDAELHAELEDAVHTALSMEIPTPHQYQQLQIALELLLQVAPTVLQTSECNNAQWTALHRACVTSNLAFVAFLFHRYPKYMAMDRDVFGLLPLDLVPPEICCIGGLQNKLFTTTSTSTWAATPSGSGSGSGRPDLVTALPTTERERIELALHVLRQCKADAQQRTMRFYLPASQNESNQDVTDSVDEDKPGVVDEPPPEPFGIAFEPRRGQLSLEVVGVVHQINLPLRVRYHLPRHESFLHGYFQLIWRADDDPRSEEPNYERHVLLRESVDALDHAAPRSQDLKATPGEPRRLYDTTTNHSDTLTGSVAIDVGHLPDEVVCHVLFVASDRQLMKREIVLSTDSVRLVRADLFNVNPTGVESYEDSPYEMGLDEDEGESDGEDDEGEDGFVFHVSGEAFTHPSEALAGRSFETVDEFEAFVKDLRTSTQQQHKQQKQQAQPVQETEGKHETMRRPSVPSNQNEHDQEQGHEAEGETDEEELVLVDMVKAEKAEPRKDNQDE